MPDNLYLRADPENLTMNESYGRGCIPGDGKVPDASWATGGEYFWVEWKRIKKTESKRAGFAGVREVPTKAAQHQRDWHAKERARGALTLIAGEDFPASIEGFAEWYQASGLQRKRISIPRA